ncbi:hypothetical protein [Candidatus Frankia nodulisporulans]|uniref:hypothetical protein n=1 Tax=Candidatus Frankia nodulisporulans TaxID=2060052 RepID=UPI0013D7E6A7|nr:hypothetical protein [Candidatus Frankia nodulisporulans]
MSRIHPSSAPDDITATSLEKFLAEPSLTDRESWGSWRLNPDGMSLDLIGEAGPYSVDLTRCRSSA